MMRNIFLLGAYPPPYGGVAMFVHTLHGLLTQQGFKCHRYSDVTNLLKDSKKIRRHDICLDNCYFFLEYPSVKLTTAWLAFYLSKKFKWVKFIHNASLPQRYDNHTLLQKMISLMAMKCADDIIVVSEALQDWLASRFHITEKVSLIRSLLPLTHKSVSLPPDLKQKIESYTKLVCSIGVFTSNYGFKHVADAVEKLRHDSELNVGLILIDGTFSRDTKYRTEVLKERNWITVLENIPHPQVLEILSISDVFVRGVELESYGISRVEAIWCGVPVVGTKVGEIRGILLYDYGNVDELMSQINEALFNPAQRGSIELWRREFQKEAEKNLESIIKIIG